MPTAPGFEKNSAAPTNLAYSQHIDRRRREVMGRTVKSLLVVFVLLLFTLSSAFADISRVRVVNDTDKTVYVHIGGYAVSERIEPGKWKIFKYPFEVTPPGTDEKVQTSLIVATSGGKWVTTPEGYTYLDNPSLVICLDYSAPEHKDKAGNRVWTIKSAKGFDRGCEVKGYKQKWFKDQPKAQPQAPAPAPAPAPSN